MWQTKFALWACSLLGLACNMSYAPDASIIQAAYDREASVANSLHDQNLRVIEAQCSESGLERFLCQVTFLSKDDPTERLYFDIVAVARSGSIWELKSGLCKR
jgi:hypothetical protein